MTMANVREAETVGDRGANGAAPPAIQMVTTIEERIDYDFFERFPRGWIMESSERLAMIALLSLIKPACSIEIGTRNGGSTAIIAEHSRHVFTLDIDPSCEASVRGLANVELLIGDSKETLPGVLEQIAERGLSLEFVLIDGDHSQAGVRGDIEPLLDLRPTRPCYILMHDSFNPACRQGMATALWARSPYVHKVDLDFIPGKIFHPDEDVYGNPAGREMWFGLGLAVLRPERREGPIKFLAGSNYQYALAYRKSVHRRLMLANRWLGPRLYQGLKAALGYRYSQRLKRLVTGEKKRPWDVNS
jgi:hypothetical protein